MATSRTSSTSYCSASELLKRVDRRTVARLCSDTTTPVVDAQLEGNANLDAALLGASGEVEAACLVGERYSPTDLALLEGAALAFLQDIVAGLAITRLYRRRPNPEMKEPAIAAEARAMLQQIRDGERIFGTDEHADAGVMQHDLMTQQDFETRFDRITAAEEYFGRRAREGQVR